MPTPIINLDPELRHIPGVPASDSKHNELDEESELYEKALGTSEVVENEDGSVDVIDSVPENEAENPDFYVNLAVDVLDDEILDELASDFVEKLEKDKESRKKRDEQYADGIRRTGLGDDAPGGAQFAGASRVVHPILAEACVDFSARAIKELFPSNGPVKTSIKGKFNKDALKRAELKAKAMNWQLTRGIPEYRDELEQLLTQTPMGGSQYQKFWVEDGEIRTEFVPIDNILIPFSAGNFYRAQRVTHVQDITRQVFESRIDSGMYRDIEDSEDNDPDSPEATKSQSANNKVEGKTDGDAYNEDGLRRIFEISALLELDDPLTDGKRAPYILTIDESTEEVLAVYRNWEQDDKRKKKLDWMVEYKFIPWRGAYGIGLPHLIGGLSAALTGALRALLDSAHINNAATMLKLKGGRVTGQSTSIDVTQVQEIEAPAGVDDIKKIAMPMPFNPPSQVLFQLLGFLENAGKSVIATSEEMLSQVGDRTPVGTTMALIEQGSGTYAAIHARLHHAQAKALEIISRLNRTFPEVLEEVNEVMDSQLGPEDFADSSDIEPVSDPNIFSESQRYAQYQAVTQMMQDPSVQWDKVAMYRIGMKLLKFPFGDEVLPEPPEAHRAEAVDENVFATKGLPIQAYAEQEHVSHLMTHLLFATSPIFGGNPILSNPTVPTLVNHCKEHLTMFYEKHATAAIQALSELNTMQGGDGNDEAATYKALMLSDKEIASELQQIMPMLEGAMQIMQKNQPPPQLDPASQVAMQLGQAEIARKTQYDQATMQYDQAKLQAENQMAQMKAMSDQKIEETRVQMEHMQMQFDAQIEQMKLEAERQRSDLAQQTEIAKNDADNQQKHLTDIMKNTADNQSNETIAQMKLMFDAQAKKMEAAQAEAIPAPAVDFSGIQSIVDQLAKSHEAMASNISQMMTNHGGVQKTKTMKIQKAPDGTYHGLVVES